MNVCSTSKDRPIKKSRLTEAQVTPPVPAKSESTERKRGLVGPMSVLLMPE